MIFGWKVPSDTAGEQYQVPRFPVFLPMTPFHLVAKLDAAPELVSDNDVSMVFNGVPVKKFNFLLTNMASHATSRHHGRSRPFTTSV